MNLYIIEFKDPDKDGEDSSMHYRAESPEHACSLVIADLAREQGADSEKLVAKLNLIETIYVYELATNVDGGAGWTIPTTETTFDVTKLLMKKPRRAT
jgi:hypothetical protein